MRFLLPVLFVLTSGLLFGQANFWSDSKESEIPATPQSRLVKPDRYRTQRLNLVQMKALLATVPQEAEFVAGDPGLLLSFPLPYGGYADFEVWEAPVMAPELTARYPEIRSYAGRSRQGDYVRFDVSPAGLHAMILPLERSKAVYIDPYTKDNTADYICYDTRDYRMPEGKFMECLVSDDQTEVIQGPGVSDRAGTCGNLRTYRLALACTGEYANFHGATGTNKAPALAAMNTSMTRVNGVFELDAGLRMVLIANTDLLIYTNPSTDPYTNNNGSTMLTQNINTCNSVIGSANYDIGHVFSTGGGGVAYLSCVCTSNKAGGVTGSPSPVGDPFDIDYVAHEMGHQYGAQHTQYNNCQRSNASAMEPGSASTIMGYAGICTPNVQNNSDDYFHARSIGQMATFINGATGNSCATLVPNGNSAPALNALTNRTIPRSTPFVLTAVGSDPDGGALSYCWEQMNAYSSPAQPMPPATTNKSGPVFRSFDPTASPSRYFPRFDDVLNNINSTWEKLPSISRTLSFRVTLRDNNPGGGCTTERDMTVTVTANAGPFVVTQPNTAVTWAGNSTQTVTWNVAGTTGNGVNCSSVNILLSTDGGATFSTLVAGTPNDGSQAVTIPNVGTTQARIMVEAVNNVFYDISNANFTIQAQLQDFGAADRDADLPLDVFPNPTGGWVQVNVPDSWGKTPLVLRIWNLDGRLLLENTNFVSGAQVDVTALVKGAYQLEVLRDGDKLQRTLIRQ